MAHNFFTPGKRSLAVIDEMVNDKYPEPLIHEGTNLKKKKEDIEQKTKMTKMIQQSKYCLANHFKAPGIRKTIFFLLFLLFCNTLLRPETTKSVARQLSEQKFAGVQ